MPDPIFRKMNFLSRWAVARLFFLIFLPATLILVLVSGWAVISDAQHRLAQLESRELARVEVARKMLGRNLQGIVTDLHLIASSRFLEHYLEMGEESEREQLEEFLIEFTQQRGIYDQVRYLDATGQEVVRVNYIAGKAHPVAPDELQNKAHRYYFVETMKLIPGEVYLSDMDLNIERKQVEHPRKPMIRIATPVRNFAGNKRGMVVLNYLAANQLDHFAEVMYGHGVEPMLLDSEGYWLRGPDPEQDWGMMRAGGPRFGDRYPKVWREIEKEHIGSLLSDDGLFVHGTVYPLDQTVGELASRYSWIIVTYVPSIRLPAATPAQYPVATSLLLVGLLVAAVISWLLARAGISRREAAIRESELQAQLAHMGRLSLMGELTTTLAHEINNPLGSIANYAASCVRRIEQGAPADILTPQLEKIGRQARLAGEIIRQVRGFVNKDGPARGVVNLNGAVHETLELLEGEIRRSGLTVSYEPEPDLPQAAMAKTQLQQIMINLIMNGIDAMREVKQRRPRVWIRARVDTAGMLEVSVDDNGAIVEVPERLFEPFFTTKREGLGMGLAICRTLTESQGGRIWASIRDGHGLSVHFTVPPAAGASSP